MITPCTPRGLAAPAWTAFLGLPVGERAAFLAAATAFANAALPEPHHTKDADAPAETNGSDPVKRSPDVARPGNAGSGRHAAIPHRDATFGASTLIAPERSDGTTDRGGQLCPRIGGEALDMTASTLFEDPNVAHRWRPGARVRVYCAGSEGLRRLMRPLRLHAYHVDIDRGGCDDDTVGKVGISRHDLSLRMRDLGSIGYASLSKAAPGRADAGFGRWVPEPLPMGMFDPAPNSPVANTGDGLEVTLPADMTVEAFDQALARTLAGASLSGWALSRAGRMACAACGVDPLHLVRATPGPGGTLVWAKELTLIRPRFDGPRLLRLCESLVLAHMMADVTDGVGPALPRSDAKPAGRVSGQVGGVVAAATTAKTARNRLRGIGKGHA